MPSERSSLSVHVPSQLDSVLMTASVFFYLKVGVALDETVREKDLTDLLWVFGCESSTVSTLLGKID